MALELEVAGLALAVLRLLLVVPVMQIPYSHPH
jgi:hypothetical protein